MAISSSPPLASASTQPLRTTKETHPNLPPGLILDANGKVCKVCNSWQDWAKVKKVKTEGEGGVGVGNDTKRGKGMGAFAGLMAGTATGSARGNADASQPGASIIPSQSTPSTTPEPDRTNCPPDTAQLGRSTWTFLHTTAAYYPLQAPPTTQKNMIDLLSSLSLLYPCTWCATDFQQDVGRNPPDVTGREGLMRWLCERHNEVNQKLGKKAFGCDAKTLDERWKDGPADGSCD